MQSSRKRLQAAALLLAILGPSVVRAQSNLPTITSTGGVAIPTATSGDSAAASTSASQTDSGSTSSGDSSATGNLPNLSSQTDSSASPSSTGNLPGLSSSLPSIPTLTGLPSLPGGYNYPPPTVPPTAGAPYLQKSNLPEDTVFIVVGAAIAFVAVVILAWRILVAWSINRSVKNAAASGYSIMGDPKSRKKSGMDPYRHAPMASTISLEKLGSGHRTATNTSKGHTPNASLFFSPTAGAGMHTPSNRNSSYLPSGYYAAGTAAPGGSTGTTTIGGVGDRGSKLRPQSGPYVKTRSVDPSPPDSPDIRPSTGGVSIVDSRSSLQLVPHQTTDRTPSAYLEDMMSNSATPPPPRHTSGQHRPSASRDGSGVRRVYRE